MVSEILFNVLFLGGTSSLADLKFVLSSLVEALVQLEDAGLADALGDGAGDRFGRLLERLFRAHALRITENTRSKIGIGIDGDDGGWCCISGPGRVLFTRSTHIRMRASGYERGRTRKRGACTCILARPPRPSHRSAEHTEGLAATLSSSALLILV